MSAGAKSEKEYNMRSRSTSRKGRRGPVNATPSAPTSVDGVDASLSPSRAEGAPPEQQNTTNKENPIAVSQDSLSIVVSPSEGGKNVKNSSQQTLNSKSGINEKEREMGSEQHPPGSGVSDNRDMAIQTDVHLSGEVLTPQEKLIQVMADELKAIRSEMSSLKRIENSTASLANQMGSLVERTAKLEETSAFNSAKITGQNRRSDQTPRSCRR